MNGPLLPTVVEEPEGLGQGLEHGLEHADLEALQLQAQMVQMGMQAQMDAAGFAMDPTQLAGLEAWPTAPGVPNLMCAGGCRVAGSARATRNGPLSPRRRLPPPPPPARRGALKLRLPALAHPPSPSAGPPSRRSSCRSRTTCRSPAATRSWR